MKLKKMIYLICFFIVIFPFVLSMLYSIPGADDFAMIYNPKDGFFLFSAMKRATNMYFTWSGLWIYMFIEFLCNPVTIFGPTSLMYGVVMIVLFGMFLLILFYLIKTILKDVYKLEDSTVIFGCFILFLMCFLNTGIYTEIFYWFIGSVYMWAVSLCMLTVALEIKYFTSGFQRKYAVELSVIGFIACSFFQAAVFPGMVYLVLWIHYCKRENKFLWKALIPLMIMIAGGLISVVAPGNYVRHDSYDNSGLHFGEAIWTACFNECIVLFNLIKKPFAWILVSIFSLLGAFKIKELKCEINPIWYAFIIFLILFLTCYPLALGISQIGLPNRYVFLLNSYASIMIMAWSMYLGTWLKNILPAKIKGRKCLMQILIGSFATVLIIWGIFCYKNIPFIKTFVNMDEIRLCHDNWIAVYEEIQNTEEADVVLHLDKDLYKNEIIMVPGASYNEQYWENVNMAGYFGKTSIVVIYM